MDLKQELIAQKVGNGLTGSGATITAGSALGGWISANHEVIWFCFGIVGVIVGLVGLCVQIHFARLKDKRHAEYHAIRMEEARMKRIDQV